MIFSAQIVAPGSAAAADIVPLAQIPAHWDKAWTELAAVASEPNPFAECWFMRAAIRNLGTQADDRMIAIWRDGLLIGLLPLTRAPRYGRIPVAHVENWVHYHCFLGTPLVRAGAEACFWEAVLEALDNAGWASHFFHLVGLDPAGPVMAALQGVRRTDIVHRSERAELRSDLSPDAYYAANVRHKKRKEIRRLRARLDERGAVAFTQIAANDAIDAWIDRFLTLEASGWKGREGSALNANAATRRFLEECLTGAHREGKLDMLRLTLDGAPIAMLVTFLTPPGSFAFKIAFDEDYARFSPGVLINIENLKMLDRDGIAFTDSCAAEDHPMINSLWAERRGIVRVTVPLGGVQRRSVFHAVRAVETLAARVRGRR